MAEHKTKVLIIGSGPAGYTAGIYVARSDIKPIILTGFQTGGQLTTTTEIENYPGFPAPILGAELMDRMSQQCQNLGAEIVVDKAKKVDFSQRPFAVETENGDIYIADTIVIATGASAKRMEIEGEEKFWGYGVSACATCDGFFYKNKDVVIVGGGNHAAIEAVHLAHIAKSVTLIHRRDELRAEKVMIERMAANPKIKIEYNTVVESIDGIDAPHKSVTGMTIRNKVTEEVKKLKVEGIFIAIGHKPNTDIFEKQLSLDEYGYILTYENSSQTSVPGIFAAGDVSNPRYKQAIVAAASGCTAGLDAVEYLKNKKS